MVCRIKKALFVYTNTTFNLVAKLGSTIPKRTILVRLYYLKFSLKPMDYPLMD